MNIKFPLSHRGQEPEKSVLYVVGTPIGNLNDISLRALNILKNVSLIACEDTRQTRKLMNKYEISNNLISFNKHNSLDKIPRIIDDLKAGNSIALVSDSGMPSICDPGEDLIKDARINKIDVICIPGPCAAITALVSSGLPSSGFIFMGFLPKNNIQRMRLIFEISKNEKTTVLYEAPHRLKQLLIELKNCCGGDKEILVFRELTKKYEEQIGTTVNMVLSFFEKKEVRGEITIVIKGTNKIKNVEINEFLLKKDLNELVDAGLSLSAASKYLAKKNKLKKSVIYNLY
ncbi:16S rRNA (cytidine(1402)-2'-O)-methyltransferase [Prochlorococcus sp. AH-716-P08]|nr:16S rRNA (cytidine(1402)-2'-O)-methyltransferase [Prochlorococcus sp. AH-716-P08]